MGDTRVGFLTEPNDVEAPFRDLTQSIQPLRQAWTDSYLAAVALAAGLVVATLDRGFRSVKGLEAVLLQEA